MKKMKKLFAAFLVTGLVLVPTLNAEGESELSKLIVDGKDILSSCTANTENTDDNELLCNVEIEWNTLKLTVETEAAQGSSITAETEDFIKDGVSVSAGIGTSFPVVLEKTVGETKVYTTYTINVTRKAAPQPKLTGLSVKLTADGENLIKDFAVDKTYYSVSVPYGTKKVIVEATAPNTTDYEVEGTGELTIDGYSSVSIVVNAGGTTKYYNISIEEEENPIIEEVNNILEEKGITAELTGIYGDSAEFTAYEILDDGKTYVIRVYEVKVNDESTALTIVADFEKALTKDAILGFIETEDKVLTEGAINAIKNSSDKLMVSGYDVVWIFDGSKLSNDFKGMNLKVLTGEDVEEDLRNKILNLVENKEKSLVIDFVHSGNLPKGTKVRVYVDSEMFGDEELTLYYYNTESGKLNVVSKKLKVANDEIFGSYVEIELDHCGSYVLTTSSNNAQTGVMNVVFYIVMALGSLTGIVFLSKKKAN